MLFLHLLGIGTSDPGLRHKSEHQDDHLGRQLAILRPGLLSYLARKYARLSSDGLEDAFQEALIYVVKQVSSGLKIKCLEAYVRMVAVNKCIDLIRGMKDDISIDGTEGLQIAAKGDAYEDTCDAVWIDSVLSKLTDYERLIVQMSVLDGYTYREISRFLAQSETWKDYRKSEAQVFRDVKKVLFSLRKTIGDGE